MAISRVGFVSSTSGTSTGWTCTIPAGAVAGDVIYVAIGKATNAALTTVPTGYTLLDTGLPEGTSNNFTWWYAKVLVAGDPGANHVWAWASAAAQACGLILRGCDTAQVLDVADPPTSVQGNGVTTVNTPTSTSVTAGAWVIWTATVGTAGTKAWPATVNGNTATRELGSASGLLGLAWATYPTAGAVAAAAVTLSVSTRATAKTLIARPFVPAPVATLSDNFNDNNLNSTLWLSGADAGTAVAEVNQRLELDLNDGGTGYCLIYSKLRYDLTGGQVLVECVDPGLGGAGRTAALELEIDASNVLKLVCDGPTFLVEYRVGGTAQYPASVPFGTATRWWRMREASGRTYFEYSATGFAGSWTTLFDVANPLAVTALLVKLTAGTYSVIATPGVPKFDNLNITPVAGPLTQRWTGSAWQAVGAVQRWDGGAWVPATVKRWNGTSWV